MSIALDVGSYRLKSLRRQQTGLAARGCRAAYAVLPDSPSRRQLLEQGQIAYASCEDGLLLIGDAAAEFARLFQVPCLPLLPDGRLPQGNPPARQALASLIDALVPEAAAAGEACGLIVPDGIADSPEAEFVARLLRLRGYRPLPVSAGMALVLAELVGEAFTGIGVSFGAGGCQFALAQNGVELASCPVPLGGNSLDEQLARDEDLFTCDRLGNRHLDVEAVLRRRREMNGSLLAPGDEAASRLTQAYRELLRRAVGEAARSFAGVVRNFSRPLTVVAGGGTARMAGFEELLAETFHEAGFPLPIGRIRVVTDSDYTIPRGALIRAELEAAACSPRAA